MSCTNCNTPISNNSPCVDCAGQCKDTIGGTCVIYNGNNSTCQSYISVPAGSNYDYIIQLLLTKICDLQQRVVNLGG